MPSKAVHDPGAELAQAMADLEATEGRYQKALEWLEVGAERSPLPRSYRAKRDAWLTLVRGSPDTTPRSRRREITSQLPD